MLYGTKARHEVVPAGQHAAGKYNLAKVNGLHSGMDSYLDRYKGRAFSIKYLDLNLMLFWWLQKYKDYPVEEKVQALYNIMNDEIPDIDTRERVRSPWQNYSQGKSVLIQKESFQRDCRKMHRVFKFMQGVFQKLHGHPPFKHRRM